MKDRTRRAMTLLMLAVGVRSTVVCIGQTSPDAQRMSPLHLTVELVSLSYCAPETFPTSGNRGTPVAPTIHVGLQFHLRIQNVSQRSVILCKDCIEGDGSRLFATEPDGTVKLVSILNADTFGYGPKVHYPSRPNGNYAVLKPGEVLNADRINVLPGVVDSVYPPQVGGIANGRYSFEAEFESFWERPKVITSLRRRWRRYGDLYTEGLVADPIPIQFAIPDNPPPCR